MKEVRGWGGGGIAGATFCHPVGEKVEDVQSSEIAIEGTTVCHKGAGRREETQPCCGVVVAAVRLRGGSGQGTRLLSSGFD